MKMLALSFAISALGLTTVAANAPAGASTLTDISFVSNSGNYINDTIVNGTTSPLAFTANTGLFSPFLNAADSTITLGFGNYYAIAFLGFGETVGAGQISFRENGGALITEQVTFPDPAMVSGNFANFTLASGDHLKISATGKSADRISIIADGAGLQPDGTPDAFYTFSYSGPSAVPESASAGMLTAGLAMVGLAVTRRRRTASRR